MEELKRLERELWVKFDDYTMKLKSDLELGAKLKQEDVDNYNATHSLIVETRAKIKELEGNEACGK